MYAQGSVDGLVDKSTDLLSKWQHNQHNHQEHQIVTGGNGNNGGNGNEDPSGDGLTQAQLHHHHHHHHHKKTSLEYISSCWKAL